MSKYYFADVGIRAAILNYRQQEETHIMENIIYNELRSRGYNVDVGLVELGGKDENGKFVRRQLEVDFVVNRPPYRVYILSAFHMPTPEKEAQERRPLLSINDHFRKIVIVGDDIHRKEDELGVLTVGLLDFLTDKGLLEQGGKENNEPQNVKTNMSNNELADLYKEYKTLVLSWRIDKHNIDKTLLQKHISILHQMEAICNIAVTVYDNFLREHIYVSDYHNSIFPNGEVEVHPDDLPDVMKNVIATLRHVFNGNKNIKHIKVVREYRARVGSKYRRVTESIQVLETDNWGNAWLVLCILEVSPNQTPPFTVNSHIINTNTGEVFSPLTQCYKEKSLLSKREIEILSLIAQGKLSKEISDILHISLNTANTHRQHILEKLGVDNSHEAVRYALSLGLIEY